MFKGLQSNKTFCIIQKDYLDIVKIRNKWINKQEAINNRTVQRNKKIVTQPLNQYVKP